MEGLTTSIPRDVPVHGLACAAGALAWGGLAGLATTPSTAILFLLLSSAATACADVVADSIVVELSRGEPQVRWTI